MSRAKHTGVLGALSSAATPAELPAQVDDPSRRLRAVRVPTPEQLHVLPLADTAHAAAVGSP